MTIYTHMNETVLIERDSGEAFLTAVPKTVIDAINYDYFNDYRFYSVKTLYGWPGLNICATYKNRYGWTLYCAVDGKLDRILRHKVLPYQN